MYKTVKCIAVHDGDSIRVEDKEEGLRYWLRLPDSDAPEVFAPGFSTNQPYGKESGGKLREILKGNEIQIEVIGRDVYNRRLANVRLDNLNVEEFMVGNGHSWSYLNSPLYPEFKTLQANAKREKIGLWGLPGIKMRPSNWRKRTRSAQAMNVSLFDDERIVD